MFVSLIFYVQICTSELSCKEYEPASWTYSNEAEREKAYEQCELLANTMLHLPEVKELDCYTQE